MFLGSTELRYDWFKWNGEYVGVTTFLDAGDVTNAGQLRFGNLHYAAGFGLRYNTVIGPIRLDVGYRLNRWQATGPDGLDNPDPGSGFKRVAFHFSIGEAF
jgi:outer membrane translocation and assembly module TamA